MKQLQIPFSSEKKSSLESSLHDRVIIRYNTLQLLLSDLESKGREQMKYHSEIELLNTIKQSIHVIYQYLNAIINSQQEIQDMDHTSIHTFVSLVGNAIVLMRYLSFLQNMQQKRGYYNKVNISELMDSDGNVETIPASRRVKYNPFSKNPSQNISQAYLKSMQQLTKCTVDLVKLSQTISS